MSAEHDDPTAAKAGDGRIGEDGDAPFSLRTGTPNRDNTDVETENVNEGGEGLDEEKDLDDEDEEDDEPGTVAVTAEGDVLADEDEGGDEEDDDDDDEEDA